MNWIWHFFSILYWLRTSPFHLSKPCQTCKVRLRSTISMKLFQLKVIHLLRTCIFYAFLLTYHIALHHLVLFMVLHSRQFFYLWTSALAVPLWLECSFPDFCMPPSSLLLVLANITPSQFYLLTIHSKSQTFASTFLSLLLCIAFITM